MTVIKYNSIDQKITLCYFRLFSLIPEFKKLHNTL